MRRSPTLATTTTIFIIFLTCLCPHIFAQATEALPSSNVCKPFGDCEPCPEDELSQPFCQPFGNRRLMHCIELDSTPPASPPPASHQPSTSHARIRPPPLNPPPNPSVPKVPRQPRPGAMPAWEACGRIVSQERADFWEFVACNVVFALFALCLVYARSKRIQLLQARQLAARIGLARGR